MRYSRGKLAMPASIRVLEPVGNFKTQLVRYFAFFLSKGSTGLESGKHQLQCGSANIPFNHRIYPAGLGIDGVVIDDFSVPFTKPTSSQ